MPIILCIDDDVNFLQQEKSILETNGYKVVPASDGPTGIKLACKSPIDVVVLAFKMRGMDGAQVAEALWKRQPDLPVVVCTGFFDMIPEALRWFADSCVEKSDGLDALLSALQQAITHMKVRSQVVAA